MGTMAAHRWGGSTWKSWRQAIGPALRAHQRMDENAGTLHGSWDPLGPWGLQGGRAYSTTLATLALEAGHSCARLVREGYR